MVHSGVPYFIFLADGEAPKCRGARGSLPPYPTFSTGLAGALSWLNV